MTRGTSEGRELRGRQEPRIRVSEAYAYTYGDDAAELAGAYGLTPDPWQRLVLDDWLAYGEDDKYAHKTCVLCVPRQNGKNGVLEGRELYGMTVEGERILHTAHEVKTARKAFDRLLSFFENETRYPELADAVETIRKTNGQEAIILKNGGSIEFSARSKGAARGFTVDVVVCDEAQELTDEQLEALLPTKSAAPLGNSQLILLGTPPGPGVHGEVFPRTRRKAISGASVGVSLLEWSVDRIGDVSDESRWEESNPALGYRLTREAVESELSSMSEDGFARERLGWWSEGIPNGCFDPGAWESLKASLSDEQIEAQASWRVAYGVKFSPDGERMSLAAAVFEKGETPHVEVVRSAPTREGLPWAVDFVSARWAKATAVVIDGKSNAQDFYDRLTSQKVGKRALRMASSDNVQAASSMFSNAVAEGSLTHIGQRSLDAAVKAAQKRPIGNGGGYGFKSGDDTDVTPLEAASLALWGVRTSKRNPKRKLRIG